MAGMMLSNIEIKKDILADEKYKYLFSVEEVNKLVNAGVPFNQVGPGTWAVLVAILVGKPLGILLAVAPAVKAGFRLPDRLSWADLTVVALAAAIGFTVALFFATAAFPPGDHLDQTKMGALLSVGSAVVAVVAARVLRVGRFGRPTALAGR